MAINGRQYDWEDITITLPSGIGVGVTSIEYSDEQKIEPRYGKGSVPRGYGRGNYSATGSLTMDRDEFERFQKEFVGNKGIYEHTPFTIVVEYSNDDMGAIVDTLNSCKITKFSGGGGKQGDNNVSQITCDIVMLEPILWNGVSAKSV